MSPRRAGRGWTRCGEDPGAVGHVVTAASFLADVSLDGARILVAEDSRVQATVTCGTLRTAGCLVRLESDGRAALAALDEEPFDLLVSDWMMPNCDGIELCRSVRSRAALSGLYVLFLTSLDEKERVVEALSAGADDYLVKPFDPGELVARVRAGLRLVRLQSQLRAANDVLERLAMTDPLTELANRRAFDDLVAREAATFERRGVPFHVARVDIDRFKSVNDDHGHDVGDLLLAAFAGAMRDGIRTEDVAARIGGDEFALLLRACEPDQAVAICERVGQYLAAVRVRGADGEVAATASIGVAGSQEGVTVMGTLTRADEALYEAKRRGGNAVVAASG
jgi:two-component system, cell cycle response regulator